MPKFSIVITTTRPYLVGDAIRSALAQDFEDFEVVVSDNSAEGCKEIVDGFKDQRIRYVRPSEILPLVPHWEFAFSHAEGDWQLLLCDDDAYAPNILSIIKQDIDAHPEIDTVSWKPAYWEAGNPSSADDFPRLNLPAFSGKRTVFSCRELVEEMFNSGIVMPTGLKKNLPIIPRSAFSKRILNKIRAAMNGKLFFPACPMTSSTLAALALSEKTLIIDLPLLVMSIPVESQAYLVSDQERVKAWAKTMEYRFTPIETILFPTAHLTETLLRTQNELSEQLGHLKLNWEEFFVALYQQLVIRAWNMQVDEGLANLDKALAKYPSSFQDAVHKRLSKLNAPTPWFQSLARTVLRRTLNAPARAYNVLSRNKYYRDQILDGRRNGLSNISDCTRMLGKISA